MKILNKIKIAGLGFVFVIFLAACNKISLDPIPLTPGPVTGTGSALGDTLKNSPNDSLFYRLVVRSGLLNTINNKSTAYTMFVSDNAGMKLFINAISGGQVRLDAPDAVFSGFITTNIPVATAQGIVSYNISPQAIPFSNIPGTFPNFQYPSILNPAPTLSALLRLTIFPSSANGRWVNNVPVTAVDLRAANGYIHHTATLVTPPQRYVWDRINTDPELTYLKATVLRADSGTVTATNPGTLKGALLNIGANLTVLAPTDAAFKAALTGAIYLKLLPVVTQQLTAAYIAGGATPTDAAALAAANAPAMTQGQATALASTPDVFSNPALFSVLTAQTVKGILVYHILGTRAFTNNFPTTATLVPTLLNSAVPHPGVTLQATFGVPFVSAATAKGTVNTTASNIIINTAPLTPEPFGTSDQHYLNGVLHKIDQVLLPAPL